MTGVLALTMKLIVQIFFTLAVFSFLYRDNPLYRFAEHAFVGVAAGYAIVVQFHTVFMPNLLRPLRDRGFAGIAQGRLEVGALLLLIPAVLGLLTFFKFSERGSWLARWPMAVVIGSFSGAAILGSAQGDLIPQIQANVLPVVRPGALARFAAQPGLFSLLDVVYNPILIVGVACCLVYFFFSKEHTGATGAAATVGIWFLMISFGASYGSTVMTRVSLFLERAYFLFQETTPIPGGADLANKTITLPLLAAVILFLVVYRLRTGPEKN